MWNLNYPCKLLKKVMPSRTILITSGAPRDTPVLVRTLCLTNLSVSHQYSFFFKWLNHSRCHTTSFFLCCHFPGFHDKYLAGWFSDLLIQSKWVWPPNLHVCSRPANHSGLVHTGCVLWPYTGRSRVSHSEQRLCPNWHQWAGSHRDAGNTCASPMRVNVAPTQGPLWTRL